jgi:hypothetical protein
MEPELSIPVPRMTAGPGGPPEHKLLKGGPGGPGGGKGPGGLFFFRRAPTEPVSVRVETFHDKHRDRDRRV